MGSFRRLTCVVLVFCASLGCDRPTHAVPAPPPRLAAPGAASALARAGQAAPAAPDATSAPAPAGQAAPAAPDASSALPASAPPSLLGSAPMVALPLDTHLPAVVSLPLGATGRRPIVIAAHGNYDRPEWQCEVWREIVGDQAFVLCPRGVPRPDSPSADDVRFTYESNARLEQEIDAGLAALRERFRDHVDGGPALYTGFSLGAIMGVSIASRRPALFSRLVLIEGGHDKWTADVARAFSTGGGLRVLFVCAQSGCATAAKRAAMRVEQAGAAARVVRGPEVGHRYDGPVADETKRALAWVIDGDPRFGAR